MLDQMYGEEIDPSQEKYSIAFEDWELEDRHKEIIDKIYVIFDWPPFLKLIDTNMSDEMMDSFKNEYEEICFEITNKSEDKAKYLL